MADVYNLPADDEFFGTVNDADSSFLPWLCPGRGSTRLDAFVHAAGRPPPLPSPGVRCPTPGSTHQPDEPTIQSTRIQSADRYRVQLRRCLVQFPSCATRLLSTLLQPGSWKPRPVLSSRQCEQYLGCGPSRLLRYFTPGAGAGCPADSDPVRAELSEPVQSDHDHSLRLPVPRPRPLKSTICSEQRWQCSRCRMQEVNILSSSMEPIGSRAYLYSLQRKQRRQTRKMILTRKEGRRRSRRLQFRPDHHRLNIGRSSL